MERKKIVNIFLSHLWSQALIAEGQSQFFSMQSLSFDKKRADRVDRHVSIFALKT